MPNYSDLSGIRVVHHSIFQWDELLVNDEGTVKTVHFDVAGIIIIIISKYHERGQISSDPRPKRKK